MFNTFIVSYTTQYNLGHTHACALRFTQPLFISLLSIVTMASGREDFIWLRGRPAEEPDPDPGPDDEREDVGEHNRVEELLPPLAPLPEQREAVGAGLGAGAGELPSLGRRDVGP